MIRIVIAVLLVLGLGVATRAAQEDDIGPLVSFFDLIMLHDQLPAFTYHETFDMQFGDASEPSSRAW
jgi:hypothetical protein